MPAIGAPSRAHLRKIYTISAVMAGIAGALLAQTTETVSLEVLGFQRSADVLVILILGGAGRLYGGIVGAIIFMVARDQFSGNTPQFWYFWIGLLLIARGDVPAERHPRRPREAHGVVARAVAEQVVSAALCHARPRQELRLARGRQDIAFSLPQGARYALIGPNGAGKTTLINLMTGMLRPDAGEILLGDEPITALTPEERVSRGLVRTFQINTLFPHLNALEAVTLAVCEREGVARTWWRRLPALSRPRSTRRTRSSPR